MGPILQFNSLFVLLFIVSKITFVNHLAEFVGNIHFYCYCLLFYCLSHLSAERIPCMVCTLLHLIEVWSEMWILTCIQSIFSDKKTISQISTYFPCIALNSQTIFFYRWEKHWPPKLRFHGNFEMHGCKKKTKLVSFLYLCTCNMFPISKMSRVHLLSIDVLIH
jgi:hypothetical protein